VTIKSCRSITTGLGTGNRKGFDTVMTQSAIIYHNHRYGTKV